MARDAATYRSARRNLCIREMKMVWGPEWYYTGHRGQPVYRPADRVRRKQALGKNDIHAMLKRGDYAGAVRKMYDRGEKYVESGKTRVSEVSGAGSSGGSGDTV